MIMLKLDRGCRCSSDPEEIKPELRDFVGIFFSFGGVLFFFPQKKNLWVTLVQYLFVSFFH